MAAYVHDLVIVCRSRRRAACNLRLGSAPVVLVSLEFRYFVLIHARTDDALEELKRERFVWGQVYCSARSSMGCDCWPPGAPSGQTWISSPIADQRIRTGRVPAPVA